MSENSLMDDTGWSHFTGERAFEQLRKIYIPRRSTLYSINVVGPVNDITLYIIDSVNTYVSCKAESMNDEQLRYIHSFAEGFEGESGSASVRILRDWFYDHFRKPSNGEMRLQMHKSMSRLLEAYKGLFDPLGGV